MATKTQRTTTTYRKKTVTAAAPREKMYIRRTQGRTLNEDCLTFNPRNIRTQFVQNRWKIVEGSHWILDFGSNETEAETALATIKHHGFNSICFVGRPDPSMTYFLRDGKAVAGAMSGEDAVFFKPNKLKVVQVGGSWKIVEDNHWLMDFGSKKSEAQEALAIIKYHGFTKMCFVGRPHPSMTYFLKGPRAVGYPTKWVIPEIKIKLEWDSSSTDARLARVRSLCRAFNVRLFDATDGQCRVAKFSIHDKSASGVDSHDPGVGNIYTSSTLNCAHCSQHGHSSGRPNAPNHFHVRLHNSNSALRQQAGTMFMEWCHSYTGTRDEYETINHAASACPATPEARAAANACIMYKTGQYDELCRAENHNPTTEQGQDRGMSCYDWIAKVMNEAGKGHWQVPSHTIAGPEDPIDPKFEYNF